MSENGTAVVTPQVFVNKAAKKIVIGRKAGDGGREISVETSTKATGNAKAMDAENSIPISVNEDLEEGEIDAGIPTTSTASRPIVSSKPPRPISPVVAKAIEDAAPSTDEQSSATNGEQSTVQRKLTALERLKSLSFATSKSAVNPFTLAAPKQPTTTPADYKNDKKHVRQHSPSFQPSTAPPPKKHRPAEQPMVRPPAYERRHGRLNMEFDDGPPNFEVPFNRYHRPPPVPRRADFPFPVADIGQPPGPGPSWIVAPDRYENLRHPAFEEKAPVERRQTPPIESQVTVVPLPIEPVQEAELESAEPETVASTISWEKVHDLTITVEELNAASIGDLRSLLQYLLVEETTLIQLHLRLQDQMKNVRRTLDREKQIDQLKKQAITAALAAKKVAKESETPDLSKSGRKAARLPAEIDRRNHDKSDETDEPQASDQIDFEAALKKSIVDQAAARKAHIVQYVQAASSHRYGHAGGSTDYDPRYGNSSNPDQSSAASKEKFIAMLTSFFDGVASMNDRSVVVPDNPTT